METGVPQDMTYKVFLDLAVSLGVGLLVGLQRERSGAAIAGIRTFPLISLAGTLSASLPPPVGIWAVATGMLCVIGLAFIGNQTAPHGEKSPGVTTEAAMVVMFIVGAMIFHGPRSAAVAVGVTTAVLLHAKPILQNFSRRLDEADLRAIMQFAVVSLIVLPVAPDKAYGPFQVLNPREIWLMVVLVVGISLAGYVAYRLLGDRKGTILAGLLGGLISSTVATVTFARKARETPASTNLATLAIVIASCVLCARLLVVLCAVAGKHWHVFAVPVGILIGIGVLTALVMRALAGSDSSTLPPQKNPTQLGSALLFAGLFAVVVFGSAAARHYFGNRGGYAVGFLSGLTDMDAIALATGKSVAEGAIDPQIGVRTVLMAFMANTATKAVVAAAVGGVHLAQRVTPFMALQIAAAAVLFQLSF